MALVELDPFASIPPKSCKPENFFPCINREYRDQIRESFLLLDLNDVDSDKNLDSYSFSDLNFAGWTPGKEPFDSEKPEYATNTLPYQNIKKGKRLDVIELLSGCQHGGFVRCVPNSGDSDDERSNFRFVQVGFDEAFKKKKYVMVFCVFVPAKWREYNATNLCRLSVLSSELLHSGRDDVEMVMVAKMRKNENQSYDDEEAFHTFFTAFPGRLAIPYSNNEARDEVCAKLNFDGRLNVVLVGPAPQHEILQCNPDFLLDYGAAGYPFTDHALQTLSNKASGLSLPDLLCCDPSFCLSTFGSQQTKSISVEQLSQKLVGLYLFQIGNRIRTFYDVYNKCQQHGYPFEIVLVCMPLYGPIYPDVFQEEVHQLLGSVSIDISSWWVFPYNNSACLRIWEMFSEFPHGCGDGMIIVGPGGKIVDACGDDLIHRFGINGYPFSREELLTKYVKRANEVTLESLLRYGTKDYVERDGKQVPLSYLKGRNVFLYVDRSPLCLITYGMLCEWYHHIRKCDPSFELVFVWYKTKGELCPPQSNLPWLVCCCDPDHSAWLQNHSAFYFGFNGESFIEGLLQPLVIAFGKDGGIHMIDPFLLKRIYGSQVNPFKPEFKDLRRDVMGQMKNLDFMRDY